MKSKLFEYMCFAVVVVALMICVLWASGFATKALYQRHAISDGQELLKSAPAACRDHVEYLVVYNDNHGASYVAHAKPNGGWFTC